MNYRKKQKYNESIRAYNEAVKIDPDYYVAINNRGMSKFSKEDYESVVNKLRLKDGSLWPIPINLDITNEFSELISTFFLAKITRIFKRKNYISSLTIRMK